MNINEHMFWFLRSESQQFLAIQHDFILFTYTVSNPNLIFYHTFYVFNKKSGVPHFFSAKKKKVLSAYFLKFFPNFAQNLY